MPGTNAMIIQPRDRQFLSDLSSLRAIDREQAKIVAGFGSTTRANTRLLKLTRAGLLRRFFLGSGGGRKALYSLSEKGAALAGVPFRGIHRTQNAVLVADFFIEHQLALNAVLLALKHGKAPAEGIVFRRWMTFSEPIAREVPLIPDGYVEFATPGGIAGLFLEIDLGNEILRVWREKVRKYVAFAVSGAFGRTFGQERFRVLVVGNSPRRVESLRKVVAEATERIFRFATLDEARTGSFLPVWKRPVGNQTEPLFEDHP